MKDMFEVYTDIQSSNLPQDTKEFLSNLVKNERINRQKRIANKSGIVQIDEKTKIEIARFETKTQANIALGKKENASGISDAVNVRNGFHYAYGFLWCHADEWDTMSEIEKNNFC